MPRGKGGAQEERKEVVVREGGARQDREERGRTLLDGENERVAKKNTKRAKKGKRQIKVNFQRTVETLLPTSKRLQQPHLLPF